MTARKPIPPGFYSYKHLEGADRIYLNRLRVNLEHDLLTVTGLPIKLWQDVDEIKWGQEWKRTIDKGLANAAFLIPVITPGYLYSEVCRDEFEKFAAFEKKRLRTDLILPLIYVRPDDFEDENARKKDPIIRLCLERQYVSWEDLRGLGDEGPEYRTRLTTLSKRIRELLKTLPDPSAKAPAKKGRKKAPAPVKKFTPRKIGHASGRSGDRSNLSSDDTGKDDVAPQMQRTLYVNRLGLQGTFQTIGKALAGAQGGDRILVAAGHYSETIELTKPVVIVGEGNLGEVTVSMKDSNVIASTTPFGRLQNLALRQNGGGKFFTIVVHAGSLEIDGCEITSASISCIGIVEGAEARVRRCRVHGSPQSGIVFFRGAKGVVEECDIFDNGFSGISLIGSGDVTIRSNKVHDGRGSGIKIGEKTRGLIEDNEVFANEGSGISLINGANPTVRRNRIYDDKAMGVFVADNSKGAIVENNIFGNALSGLGVCRGSTPSISTNQIHDNKQSGLFFYENGGGVVENNRVYANEYSGATVQEDAKPQLRRNRFVDNGTFGILVKSDGGGVFEGNEFEGNKSGDKKVDAAASKDVQWKD